jgi:hypothetical protein
MANIPPASESRRNVRDDPGTVLALFGCLLNRHNDPDEGRSLAGFPLDIATSASSAGVADISSIASVRAPGAQL